MLTEKDFPRWVFRSGETRLAESLDDYDQAMGKGWFGTVGESIEAKTTVSAPTAPPADHHKEETAPPTRAELEAKAAELGIDFSPRIGDKKLTERIEAALSGQGV